MVEKKIINKLVDLQGTNFEVVDVEINKNKIIWHIDHKKSWKLVCPNCYKVHKYAYDKKWITIKDYPLGNKKMFWKVHRGRVMCNCHPIPMTEYMPFRARYHRLTQRFVNLIEDTLSTKMFTVADIARLFEIDYGVVYKIDHELLWRLANRIKIPHSENISVDEKSFRKGHRYVTIVVDVDRKKVVWVSKGNRKESLDEYFKIIGPDACAKIKTIAKDLHEPYNLSIMEHAPQAEVVADKFHVIQTLNKAINECRKEIEKESKLNVTQSKKRGDQLQWVLRYKHEKLHPGQLESLSTLQKLNEKLYKTYLLKEVFMNLFNYKPSEVKEAKKFILAWAREAHQVGFESFKKFAEYVGRHLRVILNIVIYKRTSAISEGINRKVSVIKSMAYGYKNIQYFMLKIMQRCGILGDLNYIKSNA